MRRLLRPLEHPALASRGFRNEKRSDAFAPSSSSSSHDEVVAPAATMMDDE